MLTSTAAWFADVMTSWTITVRLTSTNARPAPVKITVYAWTNMTGIHVIVSIETILDMSAINVNIAEANATWNYVNMEELVRGII